MKLGIMQPYFFPYAQQFRHIAQCDQWLIFDTVKFSRKTWLSRNRVANPDSEFSYISVPIAKGATHGTIVQAQIARHDWQATLFDQLRCYSAVAPFYNETVALIEESTRGDARNLSELNTRIIRTICSALKINTEIQRVSEMSFDLPRETDPGEWALLISKQLGADIYSNAPGGRHLFDSNLYRVHGLQLEFYEPAALEYRTEGLPFIPDLSIIDSLMWLGADGVSRFASS